jgi:hypothetical protein
MQGEGYCECGCGGLAPIAQRSDPRRGHVRGKPHRFIAGHHTAATRERVTARIAEARQERNIAARASGSCEIEIYASDGSVRAVTKVSPEDYERLARYRWKLAATGYAQRNVYRDGQWMTIHLSREIVGLDRDDSREVDHINRDRLDNRRENLRIVTHAENMQNVPSRPGTSAYRGVNRAKSGRWCATIRGTLIGTFATEQEAAAAARRAREALFPMSVD